VGRLAGSMQGCLASETSSAADEYLNRERQSSHHLLMLLGEDE